VFCIMFIFLCVILLACDVERVWGSLGFVGQTNYRQNTSESVKERLSLAGLDCHVRSVARAKN
jgi:hypothetical protein